MTELEEFKLALTCPWDSTMRKRGAQEEEEEDHEAVREYLETSGQGPKDEYRMSRDMRFASSIVQKG